MTEIRHVVWDWNGTLLNDLPVVVESVNFALAQMGEPPIDADGYRDHYTRPVVKFYEALLGRHVADEEWRHIDDAFHHYYRGALDGAPLADGAWEAFRALDDRGLTQSILSMWWHSELVPAATRLGLDRVMVHIQGTTGTDTGAEKESHLQEHLDLLAGSIEGLAPNEVLVVGDVPDDGRAARGVGTRCVLYDGGSHHVDHLEEVGWPVVYSLLDAVSHAL